MNTSSGMEIEVMLVRRRKKSELEHVPVAPKIPRVTRLMALAIKFRDMIDRGEVRDYADLARLGYVSRARMTQIMKLLHLAPDIQEQLLLPTPPTVKTAERHLRRMTSDVSWQSQRGLWHKIGIGKDRDG